MSDYDYLINPTAALPSLAELEALVSRYAWFAPLRTVRVKLIGRADGRLEVMRPWRVESALFRQPMDASLFATPSSDEVIDRFLREKNLRIVADEQDTEEQVRIEAVLDDEDQVVSEQLAEIYLAQGLRERSVAIYRKLSLLNPEKSVYFAELITKIENNN
ncbi:MAG: hypothetical protein RR199_05205 [Alistipes sp.]